jgi:exosortase
MFPSATHGDGVRAGPDGPPAGGGPIDREGSPPAVSPGGGRATGSGPLAARLRTPALLAVLGGSLLWAYWPTLGRMAHAWSTDPRYSHGYLVPLFAGYLLWIRRDRLATVPARPSWGGLALVAAGGVLHWVGAYVYVDWIDAVSLLPCLAGFCVLLRGWGSLRWAAPAIAFLAFMVPLPYRLEIALSLPLQRLATFASTYALQTLGLPALAEGNIIILNDVEIGVVEACNGLGMLLIFFAIATGLTLVIRRPPLDRFLIVLSAVPVALIANVARITVTGVMHETVGSRAANVVFHDLAGWLMMPLALGLLWGEIWLLSRLLAAPDPGSRLPLDPQWGRPGGAPPRPTPRDAPGP